jgi:hypothetical protein
MADVKYRVREFTPKAGQAGSHSFFAEAVTDNVITNRELAKKVEARGISRAYEIKAILEAVSEIILEETQENNRVQLENADGTALVSIYPKASGSVTDEQVARDTDGQRTVATADDLTADRIQWGLGATVGIKFSKQFALQKTARRVDYNAAQTPADPDTDPDNTGTGGNTGGGSDNGSGEGLG